MPDETPMAPELIEAIVRVAENSVDVAIVAEDREVRLQEDFFLPLPFLIPDDGYSCEVVRGVPSGLAEFLAPLQRKGICVFNPQPTSGGFWTVYMDDFAPLVVLPYPAVSPRSPVIEQQSPGQVSTGRSEPEIQTLMLTKSNQGLGLSIVAARGQGRDRLGIYIKVRRTSLTRHLQLIIAHVPRAFPYKLVKLLLSGSSSLSSISTFQCLTAAHSSLGPRITGTATVRKACLDNFKLNDRRSFYWP
jgi:hypothetical protein